MILKKIIIKIFHKGFNSLAFRLGYRKKDSENIQPSSETDIYHKNNLLHAFYTLLKSVDFYPKHVVDVGANHGSWTREILKYFPEAQYTLIEPQAQMRESIKDLLEINPNISFNAVGAGKENGRFKFTIVNRDDSCSFRYSETEALNNGYSQLTVPVVTLNGFIKEKGLLVPDIIKIDAEGLDIEVLDGCDNFFGQTEVFMIEAGIVNKSFSNSFLEVIKYMDSKGYILFEITDLNRPLSKQVLWLVELVFVKKNGLLDSINWT